MKQNLDRWGWNRLRALQYLNTLLRRTAWIVVILLVGLSQASPAHAEEDIPSPYEIIDAVNTLRAELGLPPLEIDPILMMIAQRQSDYQASIGTATHYGPEGTRATERATAAGYGGGERVIVAENVASLAGSIDLHQLLYEFWGDELHWNTMTKSTYRHIGVGVSVSGEMVYITLDAGWVANPSGKYTPKPPPTGQPDSQATSQPAWIVPVTTVTPQPNGVIKHTVKFGQTLWGIATAYGLSVEDLARYNGLDPKNAVIYPDEEIYIPTSTDSAIRITTTLTQTTPSIHPSQSSISSTRTRVPHNDKSVKATVTPTNPSIKNEPMDDLTRNILLVMVIGLAGVILVGIIRPKKK